jgi:scyllo-inositol 2-dehydrogenase (NAD+)
LGEGWIEPDLPEAQPMPLDQWANAIVSGEKTTITQEDVVNLTLINEAATQSNEEGRRVLLQDQKVNLS